MSENIDRDLWWEARERTARIEGAMLGEGKAGVVWTGVIPDAVIVPDLNKYRGGADLQRMHDEGGVNHVILRIGGPLRFVADDWQLTEDPTYRMYYERARALGMTIGGYFIYCAGVDEQDYENSEILLDAVEQWTGGGYMPDYMIVDDEVNKWWKSTGYVTASASNQVLGLKVMMPKIWKYFRKVPVHYSAQWFMRQTAAYYEEYMTWLDNANNTPDGKTVMNWYAWYLSVIQNSNKMYANVADVRADLPSYTSDSINSYLQIGSHSLYDLHQFTSNWRTPWVKDTNTGELIGIDANVSRKSEKDFFADLLINIEPTPEPEPEPKGCSPLRFLRV